MTALFAVPAVREMLQQLYYSGMAAEEADERAAMQTFEKLSKSVSNCRNYDQLRGDSELRLAVTFARAMEGSDFNRPYMPWLMWNRFYDFVTNSQQDAHEFLEKLVDTTSPHICWRLHSFVSL